jgi:hypothetical protein
MIKARSAPGQLSTVTQGLLRPFHLDFSQIMAKIVPFKKINRHINSESIQIGGKHARL